jgi:hypothetical protein
MDSLAPVSDAGADAESQVGWRELWSPPRLTRLAAAATAAGSDGTPDLSTSALIS